MNKIITWFKQIRLGQILTAFLAGVLLFVSTACSGDRVEAKSPTGNLRQDVPSGLQDQNVNVRGQKNPRPEVPGGAATSPDGRNVINTFERGGMNEFSDVDPRAGDLDAASRERAEQLKENAARNINEKGIDSFEQYGRNYRSGTPFGERVRNLGEDAKSSAQELTEGLTKGTQRGTENVKDNTLDSTKGASRAAEDVKENTKAATRDLTKSAQRTAEDTSDFVKDKANEAGRNTQRSLDRAGNAVQDAVD